jgi:hypothetical protein
MKTDTPKDGGPAFPISAQPLDAQGKPIAEQYTAWGMTLRDYFAGQALVGASQQTAQCQWAAESAYAFADAMLAQREKLSQ